MELAENDLIQITDRTHSWFPCVLIVDEVKSRGVQACVLAPTSNDGSARPASYPMRLQAAQFEKVGRCVVLPGEG